MSEERTSELLAYFCPPALFIIVLGVLLKVYFKWSEWRKKRSRRAHNSCHETSTGCGHISIGFDSSIHPAGPALAPLPPYQYIDYDGQAFYTIPFMVERNTEGLPKYEDVIKIPSSSLRRASIPNALPPPPLYDNPQSSSYHEAPPSYWTLTRLNSVHSLANNASSSAGPAVASNPHKVYQSQRAFVRHTPLSHSQSLSETVETRAQVAAEAASHGPLPGAVLEDTSQVTVVQVLRVQDLEKDTIQP